VGGRWRRLAEAGQLVLHASLEIHLVATAHGSPRATGQVEGEPALGVAAVGQNQQSPSHDVAQQIGVGGRDPPVVPLGHLGHAEDLAVLGQTQRDESTPIVPHGCLGRAGCEGVPEEAIRSAQIVGVVPSFEVDGSTRCLADELLVGRQALGPEHLGAAVQHHWPGRREQQAGGDAHGCEIDTLETVVVGQGVAVRQSPVVVDVQIGDPVRGPGLFDVAVGERHHDRVPGVPVAPGPSWIVHVEGGALEGVSGVVLEEGDGGVGLVPRPVRVLPHVGVAGRDPGLAVDDQVVGEIRLHPAQRLLVDLPRQVDAESIHAQLIHPVPHLVQDPALDHGSVLGLRLVSEGTDVPQIVVGAVVVRQVQHVEVQQEMPAVHVLAGVIRHDVDDDRHASLVERLHEGLELLPLGARLRAPGAVSALHGEGVGGAVSPLVVLPVYAHGPGEGIICKGGLPLGVGVVQVFLHGHQVDHVHAQVHEVVQADGLTVPVHQSRSGHGAEGARFGVVHGKQVGEVLHVHLVGHHVLHGRATSHHGDRRCSAMPDPGLPQCVVVHQRIRVGDVDGMGPVEPVPGIFRSVHREVVPGSEQIPGHRRFPDSVGIAGHHDAVRGRVRGIVGFSVQVEPHRLGPRREDAEGGRGPVGGHRSAQRLRRVQVAEDGVAPHHGPQVQLRDLQVVDTPDVQRRLGNEEGFGGRVGQHIGDGEPATLPVGEPVRSGAGGALHANQREADGTGTVDLGPENGAAIDLLGRKRIGRYG
jgi:hypothetical protein